MECPSMTPESPADRASTADASAVTTVWVPIAPIFRITLRTAFPPRVSTTPWRTSVSNPSAAVTTRYTPGASSAA